MSSWVRLWHDMPTDPKWRVIAKRSGQPLPCVVAVFTLMLTHASAQSERGTLSGWSHEDAAAALDMEAEAVAAIYDAMQGKVLDGDSLSGWERRQPKREDSGSTDRVRKHRETQRNADGTQEQKGETLPSALLCSVSVSEEEESKEIEALPRARGRYDEIQSAICEAAGESGCTLDQDISPIVRLIDAGWSLEGHILPGIRDLARRPKRPGTWKYVAVTLAGRAADIRAGPPPDAKPETASQRFARTLKANKNGDSPTNPREVHPTS